MLEHEARRRRLAKAATYLDAACKPASDGAAASLHDNAHTVFLLLPSHAVAEIGTALRIAVNEAHQEDVSTARRHLETLQCLRLGTL